jgi:hypothetical protein
MKRDTGWCYLAVAKRPQAAKVALLRLPYVTRVTDHGTHLKIRSTKRLPAIGGVRGLKVRDRTTHQLDGTYWDFATAAFRHAVRHKHPSATALSVMVHYLYNLFGLPEAEHLAVLAAHRQYLNRVVTDEQDHGWELTALRKAKLL